MHKIQEYYMETIKTSRVNDVFGPIGLFVGILGLFVSIYFAVFDEDTPELKYEIISSNNFINNKESASFLRILLNDTLDVQKSHLNISIYNIKVENKGSSHIKYSDYDEGFFGLKIKDGTILESANVSEASTEHLKGLLLQNDCINDSVIKDSTFINIPRLSLDKGDYYILHIVLLHSENSIPEFIPEGKIIGQKNIEIESSKEQTNAPNYLFDTFKGDWIIQIIRLIAYTVLFFVVIYIMVQIEEKIDNYKKRKEIALIEKNINLLNKSLSKENFQKIISDIRDYVIDESLLSIYEKGEEELSRSYASSIKNLENAYRLKKYDIINIESSYINKMRRLIDNGYFTLKNNNSIQINKELMYCVKSVFDYLNENNISYWRLKYYIEKCKGMNYGDNRLMIR